MLEDNFGISLEMTRRHISAFFEGLADLSYPVQIPEFQGGFRTVTIAHLLKLLSILLEIEPEIHSRNFLNVKLVLGLLSLLNAQMS
jgi:hypothetical protein